MTLEQIVDKLNANCLERENIEQRERWYLADVDWNIDSCRPYCYKVYDRTWGLEEMCYLCSSCEKILETEIQHRCDKTITELNNELAKMKEEILSAKERFADLNRRLDAIEKLTQTL